MCTPCMQLFEQWRRSLHANASIGVNCSSDVAILLALHTAEERADDLLMFLWMSNNLLQMFETSYPQLNQGRRQSMMFPHIAIAP